MSVCLCEWVRVRMREEWRWLGKVTEIGRWDVSARRMRREGA